MTKYKFLYTMLEDTNIVIVAKLLDEHVMRGQLSQKAEDYLEAILVLGQEKEVVRVSDISRKMTVSKPTAHSTLHVLERKGLVEHEKYGLVKLTPKGKRVAEGVYTFHRLLKEFLVNILGVQQDIAERDACNMEHQISHVTHERFAKFLQFIRACPYKRNSDLLTTFMYFIEHGRRPSWHTNDGPATRPKLQK